VVTRRTDSLVAETIAGIRPLLESCKRPLVVSHIDPDGDAIGTQLAFGEYLRRIGAPPTLVRESEIPSKYQFLAGVEQVIPVGDISAGTEFDLAVVLECPSMDRLGSAAQLIGERTTVINIDHHQGNVLSAAVSWVDVSASSVGELAYEYFQGIGFEIDPVMATHLYTAILTDTGRFRFASTTPRNLAIAADLVRAGADPRMITDRVYYNVDPAVMKLTGRVLTDLEYFDGGRICIMSLTRAMLAETGADIADTEGLVDYSLFTCGVSVGALLREIDIDRTKVSLRSRDGLDIAAVAARWGGGGHRNAAGCTISMTLAETRRELVKLLQESNEAK
jgi:phosphoesterase RecJ-like protein